MATMTTHQTIAFRIEPKKDDGTAGEIDAASVVVASSDETVIRIIDLVSTSTMISGRVEPVAAGAGARFTVTADADLGPGVSTITGVSEDIEVTIAPGDMASTFAIVLDPPVDNP